MAIERNRFIYLILIILVIILGLGSRADFLPRWIHFYIGDVFWSLMVFFIMALIFKRKSSYWVAAAAISFSFLVEFSQLYQEPWINNIRQTTIGGLVLGFGFLWTDLLAYTTGVCLGVLLEKAVIMKWHA